MKSIHVPKKRHRKKLKKSDAELVQIFWAAPLEARFGEDAIAAVTHRSTKTLQCDRWSKNGIPFCKVLGRVLYKKSDVIAWLDSFSMCANTSQYQPREDKSHVS